MNREEQASELQKIASILPVILRAPNTIMDPEATQAIPGLPTSAIKYLARNTSGKPWANHLTLALLIMAGRNFDPSSVYNTVSLLNSKLKYFFNTRKSRPEIKTMDDFQSNIDECMRLYLVGVIGTPDTKQTRTSFFVRYQNIATISREWLMGLPPSKRPLYEPYLFAGTNIALHRHRLGQRALNDQQRQRRKSETDALMPIYPELRCEAHLRWNFLSRLHSAYTQFLTELKPDATFPLMFNYVDAGMRYEFRLWSGTQFIQFHDLDVTSRFMAPDRIPELLRIVRVEDGVEQPIGQVLWFADVLLHGMWRNKELRDKDRQWLKSWGYAESAFKTYSAGVLCWKEATFMKNAQVKAQGLLVPLEEIWFAANFGVLAVDLFTTTGIRMNEAMQISLDKDCFVRLVIPPPVGSEKKEPSVRYSLRLIPKGEKKDLREDNFIGPETKRLLFKVAKGLEFHYKLGVHEALPSVPFNPHHRRAHRFGNGRYIFQAGGKHMNSATISSCMRFLLHGMDIRTADGKQVSVRAHLLRHAFATHAVQVEKIPIDIVGRWLHQKTVAVTSYYSQVTDTMVADAADEYLSRISAHIDVEKAVERSPKYLQDLYDESASKTGTLAQVVGGSCASHGLCKAQLACIGCAAKVPDPEKRNQVLHQRDWAVKELVFYRREGLMPELKRLERMIAYADGELREMDLIESYRGDEEKRGRIEKCDE